MTFLIFYPECVRISAQGLAVAVARWNMWVCDTIRLYVIKNFILYAGSGPPAGNSSNAAFFSLCRCPFGILWCINILWPMAHRCGHLMVVGFTTNNIYPEKYARKLTPIRIQRGSKYFYGRVHKIHIPCAAWGWEIVVEKLCFVRNRILLTNLQWYLIINKIVWLDSRCRARPLINKKISPPPVFGFQFSERLDSW